MLGSTLGSTIPVLVIPGARHSQGSDRTQSPRNVPKRANIAPPGGQKPTIMDGLRSRPLLQRLAVLADVDVLTAAIVMRDVDAPPLPAHFFIVHFRMVDFGSSADLGHAETADG